MGHQSFVLLCTKFTILPSKGKFSEKIGIFSKVKNFQDPSCYYTLEKINENRYKKNFFGYHDAFKIYEAPKL